MELQDFQMSLVIGSIWGFMMLTSYLIFRSLRTLSYKWVRPIYSTGQTIGFIGFISTPVVVSLFVYECIILNF